LRSDKTARCIWCVLGPLLISLSLGVIFWIADAVYGYLAFSARVRFLLFEQPLSLRDSLLDRIPPHDLYIRIAFLVMCLVAAALVAAFLVRRRQAEFRLERVNRIVENSDAVAFEWNGDQDSSLSFVTKNVEQLLGYTADELRSGRIPVESLIHSADFQDIREEIRAAVSDPSTGSYALSPHRLITREGEVRWVDVRGSIHRDAHGKVTQRDEVLVDITEQRLLEHRLQEQQKLESIGILSAGVAHEINNPLTGVINYAELISSRVEDESLKEFSTGIITEGQRIARIVSSLLAFTRRDADARDFVRPRDLIDVVLTLVGATLRKDQIALTVALSDTLPEIVVNRQEIEQVLVNLLMNGRDALNQRFQEYDEGKQLSIRGKVMRRGARELLRITVEDAGEGISPDIAKQIFDPFFTTKSRAEGTGLGLAISLSIAKAHHGDLSVESEPGQYTRFHLDLPLP